MSGGCGRVCLPSAGELLGGIVMSCSRVQGSRSEGSRYVRAARGAACGRARRCGAAPRPPLCLRRPCAPKPSRGRSLAPNLEPRNPPRNQQRLSSVALEDSTATACRRRRPLPRAAPSWRSRRSRASPPCCAVPLRPRPARASQPSSRARTEWACCRRECASDGVCREQGPSCPQLTISSVRRRAATSPHVSRAASATPQWPH